MKKWEEEEEKRDKVRTREYIFWPTIFNHFSWMFVWVCVCGFIGSVPNNDQHQDKWEQVQSSMNTQIKLESKDAINENGTRISYNSIMSHVWNEMIIELACEQTYEKTFIKLPYELTMYFLVCVCVCARALLCDLMKVNYYGWCLVIFIKYWESQHSMYPFCQRLMLIYSFKFKWIHGDLVLV